MKPTASILPSLLLAIAAIGRAGAEDVLIASATIDKASVCPGESALVTVLPVATASDAEISIQGEHANPAALSWEVAGHYEVPILASRGAAYQRANVVVDVTDSCPSDRRLQLAYQWMSQKEDTVSLEVHPSGFDGTALQYQWTFGDDLSAPPKITATTLTSVEHSYALHSQVAPTSTFVVTVKAVNPAAPSQILASTRLAIVVTNKEPKAPNDAQRALPIDYDRYAKSTRSKYLTFVTLRNPTTRDLSLGDVLLRGVRCDDSEAEVTYPAAQLFGNAVTIAPGALWKGTLTIPKSLFPGAPLCRAVVTLAASGGGGTLHREFPLEFASREPRGQLITDRVLDERLRRARAFYHKKGITLEDLAAFEGQVAPNRPPIADAGGGYSLDAPGTITFSAEKSTDPDGTIVSYEWAFGDDSPTYLGSVATHTYAAEGAYGAMLTVTDNAGARSSVAIPVRIGNNPDDNRPPNVRVAALRTQCYITGTPCQVRVAADASDPDGDPLTFAWSGCATATSASTFCTVPALGTYTATVTVTDKFGLAATASLDITGSDAAEDTSITRAAQIDVVSVPTTMVVSTTASVRLKIKNTGTRPWDALGTACGAFLLGSMNPADNTTWGRSRVALPSYVDPGRELTVDFPITAPAAMGNYNFQWRMLQECSSTPIGGTSVNVSIPVTLAPKGKALFLTAGSATADDNVIGNRLTLLGYTVSAIYGCTATSADASGKALVVIGPGASPSCFDTTFQNVPIPVLVSKGAIFPKMGMTGPTTNANWGSAQSQTQVVVSGGKTMSAGYAGPVSVENAPAAYFAWGSPNGSAVTVATIAGTSYAALFAYERDAMMPGGWAPARRVGAFWADGAAANFSDRGWKLFDAAVKAATSPVGTAW